MFKVSHETARLLREFLIDFRPNQPEEMYDELEQFSINLLAEFGGMQAVVVVPIGHGESHYNMAEGEITVIGR